MAANHISIRTVTWIEAEADIRAVRETVFMWEQNVPEDLEWDGLDPDCTHVLACDEHGEAIGTGRITAQGRIGRMAVLREWRNHGIGDLLLLALIDLARKRGLSRVTLASQTPAMGFYGRHGFRAFGDVFEDAGIPHREMSLDLGPDCA
jgi:predicted GNAT family N-acyltransferase